MAFFSSIAHSATTLLAFAMRIVGLASAFNQLLLAAHPSALALAVSGCMLAGAQAVKDILFGMVERLMSAESRGEREGEQRSTY